MKETKKIIKQLKEKTLAKEKVKEMIEKNKKSWPQKAAGHNSVPSNKPHYCVSGLLMDYPLENCLSDVF